MDQYGTPMSLPDFNTPGTSFSVLTKTVLTDNETPARTRYGKKKLIPKKIFSSASDTPKPPNKRGRKPKFAAVDKLRPLALPEHVVRLFEREHKFPQGDSGEILIKRGYRPKIMIQTPLSSYLYSAASASFTERTVQSLIKSRTPDEEVDTELAELAEKLAASRLPAPHQKIEQLDEETFKVPYRDGVVRFRPVKVQMPRLCPSVVKLLQPFADETK